MSAVKTERALLSLRTGRGESELRLTEIAFSSGDRLANITIRGTDGVARSARLTAAGARRLAAMLTSVAGDLMPPYSRAQRDELERRRGRGEPDNDTNDTKSRGAEASQKAKEDE